ncbi:MAG: hypothetical protein LT106_01500 [Burkholderiaceae bacterium]|nr:hypothetical protein [Burkholderiaceae bacterium]
MQTVGDTVHAYRRWISLELRATRGAGSGKPRSGRHLALFAWSLPPSNSAGVYRPLSFLEYSPRARWRVTAFGGEATDQDRIGGGELLERVPSSTTILTLVGTTRIPSWSLFPRTNGGFLDAIEFAHEAIDRLKTDPPSAVLASGPTFEMFITAAFVARHFRTPLILDYRDEWTECPFSFVRLGKDDRKWERRCLAQADKVLFTTRSQLKHQLLTFSELTVEKTLLLPNGWEPSEFDPHAAAQGDRNPSSTLRIALVGNLSDHAPPDGFLRTFERLLTVHPEWRQRVVVDFIGRKSRDATGKLEAFPFPANVRAIDHMSKTQAVRAMQQADMLLLIALPELERYLPGKLFDYLATKRPVLVYGAPGEASRTVEDLGAGLRCEDGNHERLLEIFSRLQANDVEPQSIKIERWLEEHRRDVLAGRLYALLDELQEGSRTRTDPFAAFSGRT